MTVWYYCPKHGVIIDDTTDYGYNEGEADGLYRHELGCGAVVTELSTKEARRLMDLAERRDKAAYRRRWGKHA